MTGPQAFGWIVLAIVLPLAPVIAGIRGTKGDLPILLAFVGVLISFVLIVGAVKV